jgi:hypothetical protein
MNTVISAVAATAASAAAIISLVLLCVTRQSNKRQQRAYIGVDSIGLELPGLENPDYEPIKPDKPGLVVSDCVLCTFRNYGGTPALDVKVHINWQSISFGKILPANFQYPDYESITTPGIGRVVSHLHLMQKQDHTTRVPIYDVDVFRKAHEQKGTLYIYGHIDYTDVFGQNWSRRFSYIYEPWQTEGQQFIPDQSHNDETKRKVVKQ